MMKNQKLLYISILLFCCNLLFAQKDSLAFIAIKPKTTLINKGLLLKQFVFDNKNLFQSNQNITILEISKTNLYRFGIGYDKIVLKPTSNFGIENKALAAINGNFFDIKNGGSVDFLKVDNQIISPNRTTNGFRNFHQKGVITIDKGKIGIQKYNHFSDWENSLSEENIMATGPLLIDKHKITFVDQSAFNTNRHPRSVLAITPKNEILLITIDGRHANAAGMSLFEVQKILQWLEVKTAINFDGGGSTTLWIDGKPENGVVNYPSDTKKWDHTGERKVANVIFLVKK